MGIHSRFRRLLLAVDCGESNLDAGRQRSGGVFELLGLLEHARRLLHSPSLLDDGKQFRCALRGNADCVRGIAKGDTHVRGEFIVVTLSPLFEISVVLVSLYHVAKLHRKRGSQHHVTGCGASRSRLRC